MSAFIKRRDPAIPGSLPAALDMFRAEVRFYQEIATALQVRVPACYRAEASAEGTYLELEDLSAWKPGADPMVHARQLGTLHRQWEGTAPRRWSWLRPVGAAAALVADLFDRTWPELSGRADIPREVRTLGERLQGRVVEAERQVATAGPITLIHGDSSGQNVRTSPDGSEVAFLDWEDVSAAPGVVDLSWLLLSTVDIAQWADTIAAYEEAAPADGLLAALPSAAVQGLLTLSDFPVGSPEALAWIDRIEAAAKQIAAN